MNAGIRQWHGLALLAVVAVALGIRGGGERGRDGSGGPAPPRAAADANEKERARPKAAAQGLAPAAGDAFQRFEQWWRRQRAAGGPSDATALAEGVAAATERQAALADLMRRDPGRALTRVLPLATLAELPEEVRARCERPLNAIGSVDLRWSTTPRADGSLECRHHHVAFAGGESWPVCGPAFRDASPPRAGVPLDGHVIDGELLLAPSAARHLTGKELAAADTMFPAGNPDGIDPVSGHAAGDGAAALIGGRVFRFATRGVLEAVETRLAAAERDAGGRGSRRVEHGLRWLEAEGGDAPPGDNPPVEPTPWMSDTIDVLFVRVDFSDFPGAPVSQADLQTALGTVKTHVQNYSYAAATVNPTVTSQLYRMPNSGAGYATGAGGNDLLMSHARNAAAADYTLANYEVVAVYFPSLSGVPGTRISYGGLASIGGSDHWINGVAASGRVPVILHEFGHNYGLYHANYWDPSKGIAGSYNDPAASSLEYGDIFDRMGEGNETNGYFNPFATNKLNWLPGGKVVQPSADGTWRIHRFDHPAALANPLLALRVPMGGDRYHWVGLRKLYSAAPYNLANAAYVVAEGLYANRPNLIDMTPGSKTPESSDREDAGLPVGASYRDTASGVRFETLASGGSAPNEWIDVLIDFDPRVEIVEKTLDVAESCGNAVLTLRRSFDSSGTTTANYATSAGTATPGADFLATSGSVTWAAGDTADKTVLVPVRPDAAAEGTESFTLTLSSPSGGILVADRSSATVTIHDAGQRLASFTAPYFNTTVYAIAPLAGGKVLVGGNFTAGFTGNIARLRADGSEDTGLLKGSGFNGTVRALAVQADGKILVGGAFTGYNGTPCGRVARLTADGALDTAFVAATGAGADNEVRAIAVEASGKILLGGKFANFAGTPAAGMARLLATGARDTANPLNLPFYASWSPDVRSLVAQADGKIVAGGLFLINWTGTGWRSGVARLNSDGTRDTSFDPDAGAHLNGDRTAAYAVETVVALPDGKYLIGGQFTAYDEHAAPHLARVLSGGGFDSSFAPPAFDNNVTSLLPQPSGAVVAGGWFANPVNGLERLLVGGAVDASFQQGSGPGGSIYALAADADGNFFVGGNFYSFNNSSCWPLVKLAGGVSAYDAWAARSFSAAQAAAGLTDPGDDPDGDRLENIAELALGTSPTGFNAVPGFTAAGNGLALFASGPSRYLQATFPRGPGSAGVWIAAQFGNLASWSPASPAPGTNAVYDVIEDSAARFTVRDKAPLATPGSRFVRFVVLPPQ